MATSFPPSNALRVAVVTGQHPYDVPGFYALWRSLPGIDAYPQHMEDFVADAGRVRQHYDVLVFYNFHQATPAADGSPFDQAMRQTLETLGETPQGLLILHHALLAFPKWPLWSELVGIPDRSFGYHMNQTIRTEIVAPQHPITQGLEAWEMVDETYTMQDAGPSSEILLTTVHPKSMRTLAWTRTYRNARVFCYESGHDNQTYANPHFRAVLARSIQWLAGKL